MCCSIRTELCCRSDHGSKVWPLGPRTGPRTQGPRTQTVHFGAPNSDSPLCGPELRQSTLGASRSVARLKRACLFRRDKVRQSCAVRSARSFAADRTMLPRCGPELGPELTAPNSRPRTHGPELRQSTLGAPAHSSTQGAHLKPNGRSFTAWERKTGSSSSPSRMLERTPIVGCPFKILILAKGRRRLLQKSRSGRAAARGTSDASKLDCLRSGPSKNEAAAVKDGKEHWLTVVRKSCPSAAGRAP